MEKRIDRNLYGDFPCTDALVVPCDSDLVFPKPTILTYCGLHAFLTSVGVKENDSIGLAISGGVDSTALALMASQWWEQRSGAISEAAAGHRRMIPGSVRLFAFVVDHGLREGSAEEANLTQRRLLAMGIPHAEVLTCDWTSGKPKAGRVQEAARKQRYHLLANACAHHSVAALLTAHHADDQAELFLLRLSRGSGLAGLAAMAESSRLPVSAPPGGGQLDDSPVAFESLKLLRPLLSCTKKHLRQHVEAAGAAWVEDPTNHSKAYARNRIRTLLLPPPTPPALSANDSAAPGGSPRQAAAAPVLCTATILRLVAACRDARSALQAQSEALLLQCCRPERQADSGRDSTTRSGSGSGSGSQGSGVTLDLDMLLSHPCLPAVTHLLSRTVQRVGDRELPPRSRGVRQLWSALQRMREGNQRIFTLGSCHVAAIRCKEGNKTWACFSRIPILSKSSTAAGVLQKETSHCRQDEAERGRSAFPNVTKTCPTREVMLSSSLLTGRKVNDGGTLPVALNTKAKICAIACSNGEPISYVQRLAKCVAQVGIPNRYSLKHKFKIRNPFFF